MLELLMWLLIQLFRLGGDEITTADPWGDEPVAEAAADSGPGGITVGGGTLLRRLPFLRGF